MKKSISLILCAAILLTTLAGCGGSSNSASSKPASGTETSTPSASTPATTDGIPAHKEELIIGTATDINNLDLQKQQDATNNIVLKLTHETLVFFTNEQTFEPRLCTGWEFTDDTHIVFKLREGVTFSDGTPLTAEDVKFTYDMGLENKLSPLKGLLEVKVVDPQTVELTIDKYSNEFVQSLASVPLSIQSKKAYESGMEKPYLIGSGPYVFDKWVEGEYVTFVKNENYWGEKKGISDRITFRPILEPSSRVIALQTGEIDVCIDPPMNELQYLEDDKNVTVFERQGTRLFYFGFNTQKAPWDNQKLRQAVACALDRDTIMDVAVEGKGLKQTTILNRGLWGFYDEMPGFDYDVERAKSLMAEAGYPNGGISTKILVSGEPYKSVAEVVQANLAAIGITVEIDNVETATLKTMAANGEHELFLWRWNEDSKVDFVYRDLFYTGSGSNYHHWSNAKSDELTDLVLTEKDQDKRMEYGKELQTFLVDQCPQVPLYIANLVIAYNKNLQGTYLYGGGNHDWRYAYVAA